MATIQQQIEVAADPAHVRSTWAHFVEWAHTGPGHLLCDDLACVDAVRSGLVDFVPAANGRTTVIFRLEEIRDGPGPAEVKRRLNHDLVVFKDYVERSGLVRRKPTAAEEAAFEIEADRKGDPPRHVRLSSEGDTTFWRSHFPT
ncbi:MAG TPA: hypothetical protein VFZ86_08195 [Thermoleophilia bacterium]|nr:hypothetical protein [Thermoleophilia bacterium]